MSRRRPIFAVAILAIIVTLGLVVERKLLRWKKFSTVESGVLYRAGMLHTWQLESALRKHDIKTVYSLTFTHNAREEQACAQNHVDREFHYLSGDGVGPDDPYLRFIEVVQNPDRRPVLVHCSAGVQRTGGAVVLYRVLVNGWSFDDAIAEMIAIGNDGNKPQIEQLRRICDRYAGLRLAQNTAPGVIR